MRRTRGLPVRCPGCPPKYYYGVLKGADVPTDKVRLGKADVCPNCNKRLIPATTHDQG